MLSAPVKLPSLNIDLPLVTFFSLTPFLVIVAHAYTLVHFVFLSGKARLFHEQLDAHLPVDAGMEAAEVRDRLRRQLPSNVFVQFLAGPEEFRRSVFGALLQAIVRITLVLAPVALLLLLQVQFLPYHEAGVTTAQRGVVVACALAAASVVLFSCLVATFPGERQDRSLPMVRG